MNKNKKFWLIEIFSLVIPVLLAFINSTFSSYYLFQWGYRHINEISTIALLIAILGNIYIYWQNKKYQPVNKVWQFTSLLLIIASILLLYAGNSISHFGF